MIKPILKLNSYLAIELCECSVADIVDPKKSIETRMKTTYFDAIVTSLSPKEILRQSSEAVNFLHGLNIIHRNIHPNNFLIACRYKKNYYFLIKLTDLPFSKNIDKNQQITCTLYEKSWAAPELFNHTNVRLSTGFDVFPLGCYFFYVLTGGKHPFGKGAVEQRFRIKDMKDRVYQDSWDGKPEWSINNTDHSEVCEGGRKESI